MGHNARVARAILVTGFAFVINYGIMLVLVPYITNLVGAEGWGWVKFAKDAVVYCTVITLALNSFASRYTGVAYHGGNYKEANRYFTSAFYGNLVLGGAVFAVAGILIVYIDRIFNISPEIVTDVKLLFLFTMLKFFQTTAFSVYECGAVISNRLYITGRFKLVSYIVEALMYVLLYHLFCPKVFYVGIALFVSTLVVTLSNVWICRRYTPKLHIRREYYRQEAVKTLVGNGVWSSLNSMSSHLNNGFDLMFANWFISPLAMGQLAIAGSISTIFNSIFTIVTQPFQPLMLKSYAEGNHRKMIRQMYFSMKTCSMLSNICFAGFISLGMAYYALWIPGQDIELIYKVTVVAIISSVSSGIISPMFYTYTLTVKKMIPCIFTFTSGVLNITGMLIFLHYTDFGIYAIVMTTAVLITVMNLVAHPLYISYLLKESLKKMYVNIGRCVFSCIVMTAVFNMFCRLYIPQNWIMFFACAVLYAGAGAVIHAIVALEPEERAKITGFVRGRIQWKR